MRIRIIARFATVLLAVMLAGCVTTDQQNKVSAYHLNEFEKVCTKAGLASSEPLEGWYLGVIDAHGAPGVGAFPSWSEHWQEMYTLRITDVKEGVVKGEFSPYMTSEWTPLLESTADGNTVSIIAHLRGVKYAVYREMSLTRQNGVLVGSARSYSAHQLGVHWFGTARFCKK